MAESYERPDPDELLARLQAEERLPVRGRLKIFLGYAAGVGKTYSMLDAAHQRVAEGVDVVVGIIETHGRKETEALLKDLEVLPRKKIDYNGVTLYEMDLDAVLARRPRDGKRLLVLVDELAHTNAPGMRHPKRYQDVEEILSAGIDVYTTVNIQHLESLNDVVQQITGVKVRETVPDRIIDEADEVELVDLPPDELLNRMREGKVYVPHQVSRALENFFRKGNLTALRELSLRRVAEQVDDQMIDYMQTESISGPWPAGERIMVSLNTNPLEERLVRAGRRLANDLDAEWFVVFVETPAYQHSLPQIKARIQRNLQLAEELGANVVNITGTSVADEVIDFAHENNITKIIVGKPSRLHWFEIVSGTLVDQIIRNSGQIDVYVVSDGGEKPQKAEHQFLPEALTPHRPFSRYFGALLLVIAATLLGFPLRSYLAPSNILILYLIAVVLSALYLGRGPSIFASAVSVLAFNYFFADPRFSFSTSDIQYFLSFVGLLIVALIISDSAEISRTQVNILQRKDQQSRALNRFFWELSDANNLDEVLETVIHNVSEMFNREVVILLPDKDHLVVKASSLAGFTLNENELAVADWVFKNGKDAGRGTTTLPGVDIHYYPLTTSKGTVGVLGTKSRNVQDSQDSLTVDQRLLMEDVVNLAAIAIERTLFAEKAVQAEMLRKTEKLHTALLNSLSNELRTPLASITGVLSSLEESESLSPERQLDPATRLELIRSATKQANRLNRLVGNLLDMTRLEAGELRLNREPVDLHDLVVTVLGQMAGELDTHQVVVDIPDDLPLVYVDAVLIAQVLTNLLDNAVKYSEHGDPIEISARLAGKQVEVAVKDCGAGIPEEDLERVFDKFFRVQRQDSNAGGKIWAANNPNKGVTVTFAVPVYEE